MSDSTRASTGPEPENMRHQASTTGITLLDGEYVLENVEPSLTNWWLSLAIGALFALGALSSAVQGDLGALFTSVIIAALIFGYVYYSRQRSRYIVTNERIKKDIGLIRSSTGEVRVSDIRSLNTHQGMIERFFSKGSVMIDSGGAGGELGINGVKNHEELAHTIREQQQVA
jgi:uncharacterized membrane protein YdbT with pleckstrin-like domain